jgi:hypothetical protein
MCNLLGGTRVMLQRRRDYTAEITTCRHSPSLADDEHDADSDKDAGDVDDNEERDGDNNVQYADDVHDYKYEPIKHEVTPVAKAFADMYRRLYSVMFVN